METTFEDFVLNTEESFFTHTPSDFRLDCDFVLLFSHDDVARLFAVGSGNYVMTNELVDQLRAAVVGYREEQERQKIISGLQAAGEIVE